MCETVTFAVGDTPSVRACVGFDRVGSVQIVEYLGALKTVSILGRRFKVAGPASADLKNHFLAEGVDQPTGIMENPLFFLSVSSVAKPLIGSFLRLCNPPAIALAVILL